MLMWSRFLASAFTIMSQSRQKLQPKGLALDVCVYLTGIYMLGMGLQLFSMMTPIFFTYPFTGTMMEGFTQAKLDHMKELERVQARDLT